MDKKNQQRERLKTWANTLANSKDPAARRRATNGIYGALHDPLTFFFMKKLGHFNGQYTHEDLTMLTIEKTFERIEQYDPSMGELTTWVYRIALNVLIDERRKFRGYDVISVEAINSNQDEREGSEFEFRSHYEDQFEMLIHHERQDHVLKVIRGMRNKKDAAILLLRFYNNYSYEEIVNEMEMPMGTIKARLKRAKEKLADLLDPSLLLVQ
jgi:RNA polymerase sigma-70 factor (ECF subfamily)